MLQCATSTYIREGSRFCKIIPLEDTPHGSLVQRELSAGTADGGIVKLVQHIKRTTQRPGMGVVWFFFYNVLRGRGEPPGQV